MAARLIAHAYTRYLGDLSGGQIVQRLLAKSLGLRPEQLSMYDFSGFPDPAALKTEYRHALEQAGAAGADPDARHRRRRDRVLAQHRAVGRGASAFVAGRPRSVS